MTQQEIETLIATPADKSQWLTRQNGYKDWRFAELVKYLGFEVAADKVKSYRRFQKTNGTEGCLLNRSFEDFLKWAAYYYHNQKK